MKKIILITFLILTVALSAFGCGKNSKQEAEDNETITLEEQDSKNQNATDSLDESEEEGLPVTEEFEVVTEDNQGVGGF